jgi:outer membrane receptor protein involved in Fe transport
VRSLNVGLTYTYLDTRVTSTTNPAGAGGESTAVPVPQNTAALGIDWRATRRLRLESMVIYDEGMRRLDVDPATGAVTVTENSDYTRWNMAAYYDVLRNLTVFVRGENLLDEEDLGYTETDLQAEDPGRFFAAGLSYRW